MPTGVRINSYRLQMALDANRDRLGYPGAMVGVWTPDGAWFGVTGESGRGSGRPPRREDHTRIGSLTKTFTVMALLQLADRGAGLAPQRCATLRP